MKGAIWTEHSWGDDHHNASFYVGQAVEAHVLFRARRNPLSGKEM